MAIISFTNYKRGQTTGCMSAVMRYIPSAKAVRDTAVEERDGKIIKSRRQHVCGREYIVFAEFSFGGTQSTVDLMKQVIDLEQDAKNISA